MTLLLVEDELDLAGVPVARAGGGQVRVVGSLGRVTHVPVVPVVPVVPAHADWAAS